METKSNSVEVGKTPCAYCGRKSETNNKAGEAVCLTHYLVTDHGAMPIKQADMAKKSMDQHLQGLAAQHRS